MHNVLQKGRKQQPVVFHGDYSDDIAENRFVLVFVKLPCAFSWLRLSVVYTISLLLQAGIQWGQETILGT